MKITIRILEEENKIVIYFGGTRRKVSGTEEPGVNLYFTPFGKLGRLEIYPATEILGIKDLNRVNFGQLAGVAEAAKLMSVKKSNFIRDFVKTKRFPSPISELASGKVWDIQDIEAFKKEYWRLKTKTFFKRLRRKNGQ